MAAPTNYYYLATSTRKRLAAAPARPGAAALRLGGGEEPWSAGRPPRFPELPFPAFRLRLSGNDSGGRGRGGGTTCRLRVRTVAAAMALPGSLNRYLLLLAQEHLEFRLPVSLQSSPQLPTGEDGAVGVVCGRRSAAPPEHAGVRGACYLGISRIPSAAAPGTVRARRGRCEREVQGTVSQPG